MPTLWLRLNAGEAGDENQFRSRFTSLAGLPTGLTTTPAVKSFTRYGTGLISSTRMLVPLLFAASVGSLRGQCAGEVFTPANAASYTARSIPQSTITSLDPVEIVQEMLEAQRNASKKIEAQFSTQPRERSPQNWPWVLAMLRALDSTPLGDDAIDAIRATFGYTSHSAACARRSMQL